LPSRINPPLPQSKEIPVTDTTTTVVPQSALVAAQAVVAALAAYDPKDAALVTALIAAGSTLYTELDSILGEAAAGDPAVFAKIRDDFNNSANGFSASVLARADTDAALSAQATEVAANVTTHHGQQTAEGFVPGSFTPAGTKAVVVDPKDAPTI